MDKVIIPKKFSQEDLVVITRRDYERLLLSHARAGLSEQDDVQEDDILQWSSEARHAKEHGTLPTLNSLHELR